MSISLLPEYWGESIWKSMYSIAYTYPNRPTPLQITAANNYYNSLAQLLPCTDCRNHYTQLLRQHPVDRNTGTRDALLKWLENISNLVNTRIGKPAVDFKKLYETMNKASINTVREIPVQQPVQQPVQRSVQQPVVRTIQNRPLTRGRPVKAVPRPRKPCNCGKKALST